MGWSGVGGLTPSAYCVGGLTVEGLDLFAAFGASWPIVHCGGYPGTPSVPSKKMSKNRFFGTEKKKFRRKLFCDFFIIFCLLGTTCDSPLGPWEVPGPEFETEF